MDFSTLLQQPVHPGIMQAVRHLQDIAPANALPRRADFRPASIRAYLSFAFLIDVLPGDYRWNLIGEKIAMLFGTDGTNTLLSDLSPPVLRERLRQTYDAVVQSQTYMYCRGSYNWPDRAIKIERLLVPLADRDGRLNAIFGLTIPDADLVDALPVFVGVGAATLQVDDQIVGTAQP